LRSLGLAETAQLIVPEARYLQALDGIVRRTPLSVLKDYLKLQLLWGQSGYLSEEVEQTAFDFQGRVLGGLEAPPPLERRALEQVNGLMGQAVGKLYVDEHFPPEAKAQNADLVEWLRAAFRQRLEANSWMTPATRAVALDKLDAMGVKVGYPDQWQSYAPVEVGDSDAATVLSARNAEFRRKLAQVGKPVDRREWPYPPQTVDASYNVFGNEIIFPAGILQPPFFDFEAEPAVNYGGIGLVIGHEITHGFDLQGSQFDAAGNLSNWWTDEDRARFAELNERVAEQYAAIEVLPGLFVDGQITVTENVADMGGAQVAFDALRAAVAQKGEAPPQASPVAAGDFASLTAEQRFFIAAATVWRVKVRDESLVTQVKSDPHAPPAVRATQPLRNMDAFLEAFGIQPGDPMYLPPEERIVVW
jgi:putative endopeptidase